MEFSHSHVILFIIIFLFIKFSHKEHSSHINCNQIYDWWRTLISSNIAFYTQKYVRVTFKFLNPSVSRRVFLYQVFIKQLINANLPSVLHQVALKVHKIPYWNSIMKVNFTILASITGGCILKNQTMFPAFFLLPMWKNHFSSKDIVIRIL